MGIGVKYLGSPPLITRGQYKLSKVCKSTKNSKRLDT